MVREAGTHPHRFDDELGITLRIARLGRSSIVTEVRIQRDDELLVEGELRPGLPRFVAGLGSLIALVLIPFTPAGVPVIAASAAALLGLRGAPDTRPAAS